MARCGNEPPILEDYSVTKQIGSGSFSFVWLAKHNRKGHEVAIKEIPTDRLNKKLRESLLSEIQILRKINHPNITRLHETREAPGRIYLILEYCTGGDLSVYINQHGRVSESTARHFLCQLAAGLRVLREHNLIHRDLKPQNLLLSSNDKDAILKIADFGFARPLQPQGLAETLCGSPLYMAPEIMQFQKYDAKADLWSVGTILYQLVTGRTPFSGSNQMHLMQNILKSNELKFPPDVNLHPYCKDLCCKLLRQNPVERLTFEEFFNHKFLLTEKMESASKLIRPSDTHSRESSMSGGNPLSDTGDSSQDDILPFPLDDDLRGQVGNLFHSSKESTNSKNFGLSRHSIFAGNNNSSRSYATSDQALDDNEALLKHQVAISDEKHRNISKDGLQNSPATDSEHVYSSSQFKDVDSLENIDQEYVIVPATSLELSSSLCLGSGSGQMSTTNLQRGSSPMPIAGGSGELDRRFENSGNHSSIRTVTSVGLSDLDMLDQPSSDPQTRLQSLMRCAEAIAEIANEKLKDKMQLEAFSIQLVCLAIWKLALHICYDWAASATDEGPLIKLVTCTSAEADFHGAAAACSLIEQKFLEAVECAEKTAPLAGNVKMPDAMELIFQEALILGKKGGVSELLQNTKEAVISYSRSATLLCFLLGEASYLPCNLPFSLSRSDRHRLHRYVDMLTTRQSQCGEERLASCHSHGGLPSV